MKRFLILLMLIGCNAIHASAQDRLIEMKLGGRIPISTAILESFDNSGYAGIGYLVEGHYYIKPKIGIGVFYSRSMNGFESGEAYTYESELDDGMDGIYKFLSYGLSGKFSTNRSRFFQAYATARFYYTQNVYDFEDDFGFSLGDKGIAGGIGAGIVFKISRTIGFNLFEINYNHFLSGMKFTKETFSSAEFEVKSGFVFNLKERK